MIYMDYFHNGNIFELRQFAKNMLDLETSYKAQERVVQKTKTTLSADIDNKLMVYPEKEQEAMIRSFCTTGRMNFAVFAFETPSVSFKDKVLRSRIKHIAQKEEEALEYEFFGPRDKKEYFTGYFILIDNIRRRAIVFQKKLTGNNFNIMKARNVLESTFKLIVQDYFHYNLKAKLFKDLKNKNLIKSYKQKKIFMGYVFHKIESDFLVANTKLFHTQNKITKTVMVDVDNETDSMETIIKLNKANKKIESGMLTGMRDAVDYMIEKLPQDIVDSSLAELRINLLDLSKQSHIRYMVSLDKSGLAVYNMDCGTEDLFKVVDILYQIR